MDFSLACSHNRVKKFLTISMSCRFCFSGETWLKNHAMYTDTQSILIIHHRYVLQNTELVNTEPLFLGKFIVTDIDTDIDIDSIFIYM